MITIDPTTLGSHFESREAFVPFLRNTLGPRVITEHRWVAAPALAGLRRARVQDSKRPLRATSRNHSALALGMRRNSSSTRTIPKRLS